MMMKRTRLSICLSACLVTFAASAQTVTTPDAQDADQAKRVNPSSTSNTTTANDTQRANQQLSTIEVQAQSLSLGGGLMSIQTAPKAVSTITRDAIVKAAPGSNFTQMITSIPGVNASTDDVTGLADGNFSVRGFTGNEVGVTVNGAPISDSGNYAVYATEYGDTENYGDITVEQGIPDVDQPDSGAAGGHIAWATIDPSHDPGVDFTQTFGSHDYERTFIRLNTGDIGPVRSWLSYSWNSVDKWRGAGDLDVYKIDGKSIYTIDSDNTIAASLQYNHEVRNSYYGPTMAQVATNGYYYDYDTTYKSPGDTNFYKLHVNPFENYILSLDGEFRLNSDMHLSVIPYFQYGSGGGSGAANYFAETQNVSGNQYEYANQDLNGDGQIVTGPNGTKSLVYDVSHSITYRPGVLAKINEEFGANDSLEYGFWYERPRQEQYETWNTANYATGVPDDLWGNSHFVNYPDGQIQELYNEYTITQTEKVFVTNTWTPSDQWLVSLGAAYLHIKRSGYDFEYPGANIPASATCASPSACRVEFGGDFEGTYSKITPALGVKFSPDDKNQIYYGLGSTFRGPPNGALAVNGAANDVQSNGTVYLNKPETAWNSDLGWRYYGERFSTNVMLYNSNFRNRQISGYDQLSGQSIYVQIPKLQMRGANAEGSVNLTDDLKLYASYTYTKATVESNLNSYGDGIYPTDGKQLYNTPRNIGYLALNYDHGPYWAGINGTFHSSFYGDYMNTERVGGYSTLGLNAGYRFDDFGSWLKKPYVKFNVFNLADHRAFINANNAGAFLASNPNHITDVNGTSLFASAPYYTLLEPRTFMITIGGSFF
jgi:iron complex outermembrane receptor protein